MDDRSGMQSTGALSKRTMKLPLRDERTQPRARHAATRSVKMYGHAGRPMLTWFLKWPVEPWKFGVQCESPAESTLPQQGRGSITLRGSRTRWPGGPGCGMTHEPSGCMG